ncbi:MAG: TIGR04222 domain-containing membrane protein, partial [Actinomycetota bacterium]|nr:TIGR04222 domain-containing membrane protein [Actinomycetota bacterium]
MITVLTNTVLTNTVLTNTVLAAEGDTWGISGPTFVVIYLLLAGSLLAVAVLARRAVPAEPGRQPAAGWDADPERVAYLNNGPALALTAALSALHVDGLVTATGGTVQYVGEAGAAGRSELQRAILSSTFRPVGRGSLAEQTTVRTALDSIRADLEERGLLLNADQRRRIRRWGYPMLAVFALGFTRLWSGLFGGKAVGLLALLLVVVAFAIGWLFMKVPTRSALGETELARLHEQHQHLSPSMRPDWVANGALAAGMGVAVFGADALWAADPAFADEVMAPAAAWRGFGASSGGDGGWGG